MEQPSEDALQPQVKELSYPEWWILTYGDDPRSYEASLDHSLHGITPTRTSKQRKSSTS